MAPPAARRKSDAAAERRRQLEEWKKKKEAQRKRQSIGGRTSLGGGAASSRPSISGVSDYSRRGSSGTVGSVAQGTPTSRLHAAREGVQQWDKDRRVGAKLAVNDAAARRKKSISPPTATAARPPNPSSSSGKKKKTASVVTRGTPSPPVAVRAAKENTPPSQGKALVPSPEAVSAFVASLRSVDVSNHHSPSLNNVVTIRRGARDQDGGHVLDERAAVLQPAGDVHAQERREPREDRRRGQGVTPPISLGRNAAGAATTIAGEATNTNRSVPAVRRVGGEERGGAKGEAPRGSDGYDE